ncbi:fungal-specific transcription factor domain-containing protein [Pilobolus umbonatus]|nr:fungal-specific transcription factor domain-containing protein [Pilobolus umbonatus]
MQSIHPSPSTSSSPATDDIKKRRAKVNRACDTCRRKKIRCDYDQAFPDQSCSSCKSYSKVCTFNESSRKRGPRREYVTRLEDRLRRMEQILVNIANSGNIAINVTDSTFSEDESDRQRISDTESQRGDQSQDAYNSNEENSPSIDCMVGRKYQKDDDESPVEPYAYVGSSSGIYLLNRLFEKEGSRMPAIPPNTIPRPVEGHEDDLMISRPFNEMNSESAWKMDNNYNWQLPPKPVVDHIVQLYFQKTNTILPILDEDLFYEAYNQSKVSTKLLVTICRSTCRLMKEEDQILKKYNINHAELFHSLQKQLDECNNIDVLDPKIETIQILLLIASSAQKWGLESKDWIATSIAVKMAQDLGLHRANTQLQTIPKKTMEANKRLWWSAYIIDRWVCASLGRPMTISDADCDVEFPDLIDKKYCTFNYLVKLSCILGDILRAMCSPRARLMTGNAAGLQAISHNLERLLDEWDSSLPNELRLTDEEKMRVLRDELDYQLRRKLNGGAGVLRLAYYTAFFLCKRPFISMGLLKNSGSSLPPDCQEALTIIINLFDVMDTTTLLCCWSLSYCSLNQVQMLLFLNCYDKDSNAAIGAKRLIEKFKRRHRELEGYIAERSIVPFLDILSSVITGRNQLQQESEYHQHMSIQPNVHQMIKTEQSSLWNASKGIDWQEMVRLMAETGYQF